MKNKYTKEEDFPILTEQYKANTPLYYELVDLATSKTRISGEIYSVGLASSGKITIEIDPSTIETESSGS